MSNTQTSMSMQAWADFRYGWEFAWTKVFGAEVPSVPWRQVGVRVKGSEQAVLFSTSLWMPKKDSVRVADTSMEATRRASFAMKFEDSPWRAGVHGDLPRGKGVDATAAALWEVRGDLLKEGLVLCYAFIQELGKKYYPRPSPLLTIARSYELPPIAMAINSWPWHHASTEMFPHGVSSSYDRMLHACSIPEEALESSHSKQHRWFAEFCDVVVSEFALSSIRHELVRVDVFDEHGRSRFTPVYERAVQSGDILWSVR